MFTIFGTPRDFKDHIEIIQRNAILSWSQLRPQPQIVLIGKSVGLAEFCAEHHFTHIPEVSCNEFGTPLMDSIIQKAEAAAQWDKMLYVSTDIILLEDVIQATEKISTRFQRYCAVVGRNNVELSHLVDFDNPQWEDSVRALIDRTKKFDVAAGDFFLFNKGLFKDIPPFAIGRTAVDNWLMYRTLAVKGALIDATQAITIVHQNHDYSHHPQGREGVYKGFEAQRNLELAGGREHVFYISDANWKMTLAGFHRSKPEEMRRKFIFDALHPNITELGVSHPVTAEWIYRFYRLVHFEISPQKMLRKLASPFLRSQQ